MMMNWSKFGNNEWQIVEKAVNNETLPPVRHKDLFKAEECPKGKFYELTKWTNLVIVKNIYEKIDVFNEVWINQRKKQGFKF